MAADEHDSALNMSMREKSLLKRRINKEHNSNFRAGYIHINEDYLHKTGIRGRKRYFLYCVVSMTFVVALANVLTTVALLFFLRICQEGMTQLEFLPGGQLLRFLDKANFSSINVLQGMLGGRRDTNLTFYGNKQEVVFKAYDEDWSSLSVGPNGTVVSTEDFLVRAPDGRILLSTNSDFSMPLREAKNFHASVVEAEKVLSRTGIKDLFVESFGAAELLGAEGVFLGSAEGGIKVEAKENVKVSAGASLVLNAGKGLYVNPNIPLPNLANGSRVDTSLTNYKVCVCMPSGRVFLVPVLRPGYGCHRANEDVDPCE